MSKHFNATVFAIISLALLFSSAVPATAQTGAEQPKKWDAWLNETVVYIISDREREAFLSLKSEKQRQQFEAAFWRERDPTPGTERNEFREEHFRRIDYANRTYGRDVYLPGWKSDRGRMYILLGEPKTIDSYPSNIALNPVELWMYQGERRLGLPNFFYMLFFRQSPAGQMILYQPGQHLPSHLVSGATVGKNVFSVLRDVSPELSRAAAGLVADEPPVYDSLQPNMSSIRLLANIENMKNRMVDPEYVDSILSGAGEVTTQYAFVDADIANIINPFVDSDGTCYIDYAFLLSADSLEVGQYRDKIFGAWEVETLLANETGTTVLQLQKQVELDLPEERFATVRDRPLHYEDRIACASGVYTLTIRIKNKVTRRMAVITRTVAIPSRRDTHIGAGPLLLTSEFTSFQEAANASFLPFEYAPGRLSIDPRNIMPVSSVRPMLYCQLYRVQGASEAVTVSFSIFAGEGESMDSASVEVSMNSFSSAGTYDLLAPAPIGNLQPGHYTLTVTVGAGEGKIERSAAFEVVPDPLAPPLPMSVKHAPVGKAQRLAQYAAQLAEQNIIAFALHKYDQALALAPKDEGVRRDFAVLLVEVGEYERASEQLRPLLVSAPNDLVNLKLAARARLGARQPAEAVKLLERVRFLKTIDADGLNLLAEAYEGVGEPDKARECLSQSLALNPEQPSVKQKMKVRH